jgi:uncharacterized protein YukE
MVDQFSVHHSRYADANSGLGTAVGNLDKIMSDLNQTLSRIDQASGGKATPLWKEQQATWNGSYLEMRGQLNTQTLNSVKIADAFMEGDSQGARIMY